MLVSIWSPFQHSGIAWKSPPRILLFVGSSDSQSFWFLVKAADMIDIRSGANTGGPAKLRVVRGTVPGSQAFIFACWPTASGPTDPSVYRSSLFRHRRRECLEHAGSTGNACLHMLIVFAEQRSIKAHARCMAFNFAK
ncbi:hypothetical protein PsYK624_164770 [Phanerochaete sordida]|uniref:Uncharacterized protein n=1 Tax=Phanerochaete sordida TaxID=48140 RepID=A0A9P3LM50_9APHY|nr:hypothetical protein PsYK624_164770 [Phanerochaete sordida]